MSPNFATRHPYLGLKPIPATGSILHRPSDLAVYRHAGVVIGLNPVNQVVGAHNHPDSPMLVSLDEFAKGRPIEVQWAVLAPEEIFRNLNHEISRSRPYDPALNNCQHT